MPTVRDVQRRLLQAGYSLPRYGADGDLGPETIAALLDYADATLPALKAPDVTAEIVTLPGCWFAPGDKNTYRRQGPARNIVLHWTGGRGLAPRVYKTLRARGLSIHFVVDPDGRIVQMADLDTRCAHAGPANPYSIGVEFSNPGYDKDMPRVPFLGAKYRLASWPEAQLAAGVSLCEDLCARKEIPRVLAPERRGIAPDLLGILGHFHVHKTKTDPGPRIFEALRAAGFED